MGLIGKSLQSGFGREIGKNTGKVVSNAIFGDKHSTPHRRITSYNVCYTKLLRQKCYFCYTKLGFAS